MLKAEDVFMVLSLVAIVQAFTTLWALKRVGSQRPSSRLETSDLEIGVCTHINCCIMLGCAVVAWVSETCGNFATKYCMRIKDLYAQLS